MFTGHATDPVGTATTPSSSGGAVGDEHLHARNRRGRFHPACRCIEDPGRPATLDHLSFDNAEVMEGSGYTLWSRPRRWSISGACSTAGRPFAFIGKGLRHLRDPQLCQVRSAGG